MLPGAWRCGRYEAGGPQRDREKYFLPVAVGTPLQGAEGHQLVVAGFGSRDEPIEPPVCSPQPSMGPGTPQWQPVYSPLSHLCHSGGLGNEVGGRTPDPLAVLHPSDSYSLPSLLLLSSTGLIYEFS